MQKPGAAVVTEAAPGGEYFVLSSRCQRLDGGEAGHPVGVMIEDRANPRLLQHDFRNPDRIRIAGATPGEIALVQVKPGEQRGAELAGTRRGEDLLSARPLLIRCL